MAKLIKLDGVNLGGIVIPDLKSRSLFPATMVSIVKHSDENFAFLQSNNPMGNVFCGTV